MWILLFLVFISVPAFFAITTTSKFPSRVPTSPPSFVPTVSPSRDPSASPSRTLTQLPTVRPTRVPTVLPSPTPSVVPTSPTVSPTTSIPSISPSFAVFTEEVKLFTAGSCDAVCGPTCMDCQSIKSMSLGKCCNNNYDPANPGFVGTDRGLAVDSKGNAYIAAGLNGGILLRKYSKEGVQIFSLTVDSVNHQEETVRDIVLDEKSQVLYIIGTTNGYFTGFSNDWKIVNGLLFKFSFSGTQLLSLQFAPGANSPSSWVDNLHNEMSLSFSGIALSKTGDLFLSGSEAYPSASNSMYRGSFLRKLFSNGTMSFEQKITEFSVSALAVDESDNIYLAGNQATQSFIRASSYAVFSKFVANRRKQFSVVSTNPSSAESLFIDSVNGFAFVAGLDRESVSPFYYSYTAVFQFALFDGTLISKWVGTNKDLKGTNIVRDYEGSLLLAAAPGGCQNKITAFSDPKTNQTFAYSLGSTCAGFSPSLDLTIYRPLPKNHTKVYETPVIGAFPDPFQNELTIVARSNYGAYYLVAMTIDAKSQTAYLLSASGYSGGGDIFLSQCPMDRFDAWYIDQCKVLAVIDSVNSVNDFAVKIVFDDLSGSIYILANTDGYFPGFTPPSGRGVLFKYTTTGSRLFVVQFPGNAKDFALDSVGMVVVLESSPGIRKYYQNGTLDFYQQLTNAANVLAIDEMNNILLGGCGSPNYFVLNSFGKFQLSLPFYRDACVNTIYIEKESSLIYLSTASSYCYNSVIWVLSSFSGSILKTWQQSGRGPCIRSILGEDLNGTILHGWNEQKATAVIKNQGHSTRDYYWESGGQIQRFSTDLSLFTEGIQLQKESTNSVDFFAPKEKLFYGSALYQVNEIRIDMSYWESGEAIIVDSKQNLYVLSNFLGNNPEEGKDDDNRPPSYNSDNDLWIGLITEYAKDGSQVFSKTVPFFVKGFAVHESSKSIYIIGNRKRFAYFHKFTDLGLEVFNQTSVQDYSYSKIAVDHEGSVYIIGQLSLVVSYAPTQFSFLRKLSSDGNTTWEMKNRGTTGVSPSGIAIDKSNNVFITGTANKVPFLRKYDPSGVLLFYKTININATKLESATPSTIFLQEHENMIYIAGTLATRVSSSFIFKCSVENGSVLQSWLKSNKDFDGPTATQLVVDSRGNKILGYGGGFNTYFGEDSSTLSFNGLAIHETNKEVTVYATGFSLKRNPKDHHTEGVDVIITQTTSVKPTTTPWYLNDPVAFYVVLTIIGFGVLIGLIWLIFERFREFTQTLFKNHWVCRFYYSGLGVLEVADIVSDALWIASLVNLGQYYVYSSNPMFYDIFYSSIAFLTVSGILLIAKIKHQLPLIFDASDRSNEYVKLHCFLLNVYYSWSLSDDKIVELHETAKEKEKDHVFDDLFGLNRENLWTRKMPYPIPFLLLLDLEDVNGRKLNTIWDFFLVPSKLFFSYDYFQTFSYFSILLYPLSLPAVCGSGSAIYAFFFMNVFENSNHLVTVRLLEDIPQLILQALFLRYVQVSSLNAFSAFSIVCSGLLLLKFLVETISAIGRDLSSSGAKEKKEKEDKVGYNLENVEWYHMLYLTTVAPLLVGILSWIYLVIWVLQFFVTLVLSVVSPVFNYRVLPSEEIASEKKSDHHDLNVELGGVQLYDIYPQEPSEFVENQENKKKKKKKPSIEIDL
jgi:hypothetical protein